MSKVETVLNKGFSNGSPWDASPVRRVLYLVVCPVLAVLLAVAFGALLVHGWTLDEKTGYVVSSSSDCQLVVSDEPGGSATTTIMETPARRAPCGELDKGQQITYSPSEKAQTFGTSDNVIGTVGLPIFALLVALPGVLAWIDTRRKRRARRTTAEA